jgi:hypothetical protein
MTVLRLAVRARLEKNSSWTFKVTVRPRRVANACVIDGAVGADVRAMERDGSATLSPWQICGMMCVPSVIGAAGNADNLLPGDLSETAWGGARLTVLPVLQMHASFKANVDPAIACSKARMTESNY